jgi:hypothetical protein
MTTRERIDLIARVHPRLFPRAELLRLVRAELGHVDALDKWIARDGVQVRAVAPRILYHLCSGNLAISACTSIVHGLLLGSANIVKLPSVREGSSARREILAFIKALPDSLRRRVTAHNQMREEALLAAEAVVAFGSDETMRELRAKLRPGQKFIEHGHALSLLLITEPGRLTSAQARACAIDVLTYDQLGCLSPQAIYVPPGTEMETLGRKLAQALEAEWKKMPRKPARPLGVAARIAEARDLAHALGHRVWLPETGHLGWTLIHDPDPEFQPSPLHGVIYLRVCGKEKLPQALDSVAGRISTIGVAGRMDATWKKSLRLLGATRFCPAGRMQFPPLTWHHDGRPPLADLVTWVDSEIRA